jgi:hypothetical protein
MTLISGHGKLQCATTSRSFGTRILNVAEDQHATVQVAFEDLRLTRERRVVPGEVMVGVRRRWNGQPQVVQVGQPFLDDGAGLLPRPEKALALQLIDGGGHGGAADSEVPGQFGLRGQAAGKPPAQDAPAQSLHNRALLDLLPGLTANGSRRTASARLHGAIVYSIACRMQY